MEQLIKLLQLLCQTLQISVLAVRLRQLFYRAMVVVEIGNVSDQTHEVMHYVERQQESLLNLVQNVNNSFLLDLRHVVVLVVQVSLYVTLSNDNLVLVILYRIYVIGMKMHVAHRIPAKQLTIVEFVL